MILEFLPDFATWDEWNGNLVLYFAEEQFPIVNELFWPEVAHAVTVSPRFDQFGVPNPAYFSDWQSWAKSLTLAVNGAQ